jgi:hypothetical protein
MMFVVMSFLTLLSFMYYSVKRRTVITSSPVLFAVVFGVSFASSVTTTAITSVHASTLASNLTIEDELSLEDPLQDRVTICHIPDGNSTNAHDIIVGEDVVSDHLTHGDSIGSCSPTRGPTITVEPPATCVSTENGLVGHARFILSGFPHGRVIIMDSQFSEPLQEVEVQADMSSVPVEFSTGEKTVNVFADTNRNSIADPGEVSATKTFTITC